MPLTAHRNSSDDIPPDFAEGYVKYRRLLMSALSTMARRGYAAPPAEGLDLVHDFFLEAWPGLTERYDPSRARFTSYLLGAFIRFARPRIVRSVARREALGLVEEYVSTRIRTEEQVQEKLAESAVRAALRQLPKSDRRILLDRLGRGVSERRLADELGTTRYRAREMSAEALVRLALALGERGQIPERDWPVARALWQERRTLKDAATLLGIEVDEARSARQRIVHAMLAGIAGVASGSKEEERKKMKDASLCELWSELLAGNNRRPTENQVDALLDHVDTCDRCRAAAETIGTDGERIAKLYDSMKVVDEELSPEEQQTLLEMTAARLEDDEAVRRAVETVLLPYARDERIRQTDPLKLFLATEALGLLVHRYASLRDDDVLEQVVLTTSGELKVPDGELLAEPGVLVMEISHVAGVQRAEAERMLEWMLPLARHVPSLFVGLEASGLVDDALMLTLTMRDPDEDLLERWAPRESSAPVQMGASG